MNLSTASALLDDTAPPLKNYSLLEFGNNTREYSDTLFTPENEVIPHPEVRLPYGVLLSIAIYLTVVGILSTFGNILFILTVMRWRYLRNNSHMMLLLNMAVADLAISITGYPYTTISGYIGRWIFGSVMCQLYAFLCFTFSQVSMNTLVAVSIFRYIAICHPHRKHFLTSRTSLWALTIVWGHALFWTVSPLLGWSSYTFEPTRISCSFDWNDRTFGGITYVLGTTLFCYLSHIGILVWCYKRIFQMVARLQSRSMLGKIRRRKNNDTTFSSTLSAHSMNISMVAAFIIFWTPYAIISVVSAFYDKLSPFWYIFPTIFAKTSCMVNPILYGFTNSFLRKQLMLVLRGFLGLTTAIEDFEVMRQREQDGLYNKEGIFVGKRSGAVCNCPCEKCGASRRQIRRLIEHEKGKISSTPKPGESGGNQEDTRISTGLCDAAGDNEMLGESKSGQHEKFSAGQGNVTERVKAEKHEVLSRAIDKNNELQTSVVKVMEGHIKSTAVILNVNSLQNRGNDKVTVINDEVPNS